MNECLLHPSMAKGFDLRMANKMRMLIALVVLLSAVAGSAGMRPRDEETLKADPSSSSFFLREDLYDGGKLILWWLGQTGYVIPAAQRSVADALPFSPASVPKALELMGLTEDADAAIGIAVYTKKCETPTPPGGKMKFCANSYESMLRQVKSKLGPRSSLLQTKLISEGNGDHNRPLQEYNITAFTFRSKPPSRAIACHLVPFVHPAFYCHAAHRPGLFRVSLESEDGTALDALAACHDDTSKWNPENIAFKVLKVKPGESSICHFFPEGHLFWYTDD